MYIYPPLFSDIVLFSPNSDINECTERSLEENTCNATNQEVCNNVIGSFECLCNDGYKLNETTQTCEG